MPGSAEVNSARVLLVGGGSLGHLAPLVAVTEALCDKANIETHFICEEKESDESFLAHARLPYTALAIPRSSISFLRSLPNLLRKAHGILQARKPDVIFCKGGRISIPMAYEAWRKRIPIVLHESDAVMGRANRFLAKFATEVCLGFEEATTNYKLPRKAARGPSRKGTWSPHGRPYVPRGLYGQTTNYVVTGNPIRRALLQGSREEGLRITGFSGNRPILLIMGGSQGAEVLNRILLAHLDALRGTADIIHLYGEGKTHAEGERGYFARPLVHDELPHLYACVTLAVSRGGANAITELAAYAIPGVLVPLPGLAQNHQHANALLAAKSGGAILLPQSALETQFLPTLPPLLQDQKQIAEMSRNIQKLYVPEASTSIASQILYALASRVSPP